MTTKEAAAVLGIEARTVTKRLQRVGAEKRGRDYDIDAELLARISVEYQGLPRGRPKRGADEPPRPKIPRKRRRQVKKVQAFGHTYVAPTIVPAEIGEDVPADEL